MKFDKRIESVQQLVDAMPILLPDGASQDQIWYRGQVNSMWSLLPSIARLKKVDRERILIERFKQDALPFLPQDQRPSMEWDWLFLMRHYGAPTRLLDWSESPLVALYFAVEDQGPSADGVIWCLWPSLLNTLSGVSYNDPLGVPFFSDDDDMMQRYLPKKVEAQATLKLLPIAGIAQRKFPRITAQHGTFTITHHEQFELDKLSTNDHIARFIIPAGAKPKIREQLAYLRFTQLTLFPDLSSVANLVKGL